MIELKIHSDIDASCLAVQTSAAKNLLTEIRQDAMASWLTLPQDYDQGELTKIQKTAEKIRGDSKFLVCIGVGGSYLGHRAMIEALGNEGRTKVLFAGNSLSSRAIEKVFNQIGQSDFSVNVISKSGTTLEPAVAFRIFKEKLIEKYGESRAYQRIYVTTDARRGVLHDEALYNHYEKFVIPDNIGGRYSVLTAVGLLPMAVAGIDVESVLLGAREESAAVEADLAKAVYEYAAMRQLLRHRGYETEVLASFEPSLNYVIEWWKQLFGESEGKKNQGIFPAGVIYTADLHAMGQYMQEGRKNIFETVISFMNEGESLVVPNEFGAMDGLDYLAGRELSFINEQARLATIGAHAERIPVMELKLRDFSERSLGGLLYFFELSCALSAKLSGVNPFDQPGVETYKRKMFELLGRPNSDTI